MGCIMKEFAVSLDPGNRKPLYEQIYDAVRDAILSGHISCGEKLPSTRSEAEFLSCSRSTVELAYGQLFSEGYIESQPCRGYYVCDVRELYHLTDVMQETSVPVPGNGNGRIEYKVDFSPNGIELGGFPFSAMGKIMRNLMLDEGENMLKIGDFFGERGLRQAICDYLYRSRSVNCTPEQIVVGAGNEYLQILLSQVLGPCHRVAMESPTYLRAFDTFRNIGYPVEEIAMDREGMRVDCLAETEADIAYVMPSHQFPMGTVMPMKRRLELLNWAVQMEGRYIIEDDYDSEFRYRGKPVPALQGMDRAGRVIYLGTFSRSIAPATRVSYLVLPAHLITPFREKCGFYSCTVSNIMQQSVFHFMKEGYFEKNLNRMRGIYKAKHDYILGELRKCSWVKKIWGENSGLHLLAAVDTERKEKELIRACGEKGIRLYGLSEYFLSGESVFRDPVFLFGYGGLSQEQIAGGLEEIGRIVIEDQR